MRTLLIGLLACGGVARALAQDTSLHVAKLDSTPKDPRIGRAAYYLRQWSWDTIAVVGGYVGGGLYLRCTADDREPKWMIRTNAMPQHTDEQPVNHSVVEIKTDSEYVPGSFTDLRILEGTPFMVIHFTDLFTRRLRKTQRLTLAWAIESGDSVRFNFDVRGFNRLVPRLYAKCGQPPPR